MARHEGTKARRHKAGFTLVELLVVIGVIVVLLSILALAVGKATRTAQGASTRSLMTAIKQGLVRFEGDIGYLPPVLGDPSPTDPSPENHDLRRLFDPRGHDLEWGTGDDILPEAPDSGGGYVANGAYAGNVQEWYSLTTLADYLIGWDTRRYDGYGAIAGGPGSAESAGEIPPIGIRDPGRDGVWGATIYDPADGTLAARMQGTGPATDVRDVTGPVFGPYIELKDENLLAAATWDDAAQKLRLLYPGDAEYDPRLPKVICDYWGRPIRYYRRLYMPGSLETEYRVQLPETPRPSLSDVFLLRPFEIAPGASIPTAYPDAGGDNTTTVELNAARIALFSSGPDRMFNEDLVYDDPNDPANDEETDLVNADNIVELGQ